MARKTTSTASKSTGGGSGAASGNPFADMFAMFDPERMATMFDPQKFMAQMPSMGAAPDMSGVMDSNRRNFEAMVEANKAAAETYRDMLEKQMDIFSRMTGAAQGYAGDMESPVNPQAMSKNAEVTSKAVETALDLMREMAEAARDANEKVFAEAQARMNAAIAELQAGGAPSVRSDDEGGQTPV